ncbi:hypothetical protein HDU98_006349 [Podochytrium sp. JEL0797]|nr:hypothetical protein HDU98_006349 [Podochytrium sp. JEL0797]
MLRIRRITITRFSTSTSSLAPWPPVRPARVRKLKELSNSTAKLPNRAMSAARLSLLDKAHALANKPPDSMLLIPAKLETGQENGSEPAKEKNPMPPNPTPIVEIAPTIRNRPPSKRSSTALKKRVSKISKVTSAPTRPPNAYILYRKAMKNANAYLSVGNYADWNALSVENKQIYVDEAKKLMISYHAAKKLHAGQSSKQIATRGGPHQSTLRKELLRILNANLMVQGFASLSRIPVQQLYKGAIPGLQMREFPSECATPSWNRSQTKLLQNCVDKIRFDVDPSLYTQTLRIVPESNAMTVGSVDAVAAKSNHTVAPQHPIAYTPESLNSTPLPVNAYTLGLRAKSVEGGEVSSIRDKWNALGAEEKKTYVDQAAHLVNEHILKRKQYVESPPKLKPHPTRVVTAFMRFMHEKYPSIRQLPSVQSKSGADWKLVATLVVLELWRAASESVKARYRDLAVRSSALDVDSESLESIRRVVDAVGSQWKMLDVAEKQRLIDDSKRIRDEYLGGLKYRGASVICDSGPLLGTEAGSAKRVENLPAEIIDVDPEVIEAPTAESLESAPLSNRHHLVENANDPGMLHDSAAGPFSADSGSKSGLRKGGRVKKRVADKERRVRDLVKSVNAYAEDTIPVEEHENRTIDSSDTSQPPKPQDPVSPAASSEPRVQDRKLQPHRQETEAQPVYSTEMRRRELELQRSKEKSAFIFKLMSECGMTYQQAKEEAVEMFG